MFRRSTVSRYHNRRELPYLFTVMSAAASSASTLKGAFIVDPHPDDSGSNRNGRARTGNFLNGTRTPNCLLQTEYGQVPYLPPDILNTIPGTGVAAIRLSHLCPYVQTVQSENVPMPTVDKLLNIGEKRPLLLTQRSPGTSSSATNTDKHLVLETWNGRRRVDVGQFVQSIHWLKPNAVVAMHEEAPAGSLSNRQLEGSRSRSIQWQQRVAEYCQSEIWKTLQPFVLGHLDCRHVDSESIQYRVRACMNAPLAGIVLGGLRLESKPAQREILEHLGELIPSKYIRVVTGIGEPLLVLHCVRAGMDLFDFDYPQALTNLGYASSMSIWPAEWEPEDDCDTLYTARSGTSESKSPLTVREMLSKLSTYKKETFGKASIKVALNDERFRKERGPIVNGCNCYSCRNYSTAYVNHLLHAHEMLGLTLLHTHNIHHYYMFFAAIRQAIIRNQLEEYIEWFIDANGLKVCWDQRQ
eukprot:gb/GECG01008634.1/.p1 GENE.gb/GECG01008634.1/~~gb/GECG01008634.1/.p1  ORF type:complete len:469 (+),score=24.28 gb/GECG01008634.1/:1-1407(+)